MSLQASQSIATFEAPETLKVLYTRDQGLESLEEALGAEPKEVAADLKLAEAYDLVEWGWNGYSLTERGERIAEDSFEELRRYDEGLKSRGLNMNKDRNYRKGFVWNNGDLHSVTVEDIGGDIEILYNSPGRHADLYRNKGEVEKVEGGALPETDGELVRLVRDNLN